jgi:hypothetical protein
LIKSEIGAGDGNRTHVASLEGWNFTIKLHPRPATSREMIAAHRGLSNVRVRTSWRISLFAVPDYAAPDGTCISLGHEFYKYTSPTGFKADDKAYLIRASYEACKAAVYVENRTKRFPSSVWSGVI